MKEQTSVKMPRVCWPQPGPGMRALLVSDRLTAMWTHWSEQSHRTIPCSGQGLCDLCRTGKPARWIAFAAGILPGKVRAIVQLTLEATRSMYDGLDGEDTFRGVQLQLKRLSAQRTSRVVATVIGRTTIPADYPVWSVLETLTHLFGPVAVTEHYLPSDLAQLFYLGGRTNPLN